MFGLQPGLWSFLHSSILVKLSQVLINESCGRQKAISEGGIIVDLCFHLLSAATQSTDLKQESVLPSGSLPPVLAAPYGASPAVLDPKAPGPVPTPVPVLVKPVALKPAPPGIVPPKPVLPMPLVPAPAKAALEPALASPVPTLLSPGNPVDPPELPVVLPNMDVPWPEVPSAEEPVPAPNGGAIGPIPPGPTLPPPNGLCGNLFGPNDGMNGLDPPENGEDWKEKKKHNLKGKYECHVAVVVF